MKMILYVGMLAALVVGVDVTGERLGSRAVLGWDAVMTDTAGNAEVIEKYEVGFALPPADLRTGATPILTVQIPGDKTDLALVDHLVAMEIPEGASLRMWVRAYDEAGNVSEWSDMLEGVVDTKPPKKPGGCRITK